MPSFLTRKINYQWIRLSMDSFLSKWKKWFIWNIFPFFVASYRGIVDAVVFSPDSKMEIIDFKNNSIHYSKAQLLFYALLTGTEFNILPEKITLLSLSSGKRQTWQTDLIEWRSLKRIRLFSFFGMLQFCRFFVSYLVQYRMKRRYHKEMGDDNENLWYPQQCNGKLCGLYSELC